jgi:hypothetical protein
MSPAQIHLMMNHVPVIGVLFVVFALGVGLVSRSGAVLRLALAALVLVALAAIPVFLSGEPTEEVVEDLAGVSSKSIEPHEDAAKIVFIGLEVLGLVALVGLLRSRGRAVARRFAGLVLVGSLALSGGLAWTAHLGGRIRHPELSGGTTVTAETAPAETEHGEDD